jgi:hypothetical protein
MDDKVPVTVEPVDYSQEINSRILNSVVRVLISLVGKVAGGAIFWNLGRDDIAERPAQFIESLEKMFGRGTTRIIESAMTKELQREFGLVSPAREEFIDVVSRATRSG